MIIMLNILDKVKGGRKTTSKKLSWRKGLRLVSFIELWERNGGFKRKIQGKKEIKATKVAHH